MVRWDHPRASAGAAVLLRVGADHGLSAPACLTGTGLSAEEIAEPDSSISAADELRIIRNLQRLLPGVEWLGLDAGRRYHLTTHGAWGATLASSRTGWDALEAGLRFVQLTWAFCDVVADYGQDEVRIVFDDRAVPADVRQFLALRELTSTVTVAREATGLLTEPAVTYLRQPAPAATEPFVEFFGVTPVFGSDMNAFAIPVALLAHGLPQADPHAAAATADECRRLLEGRAARAGVAGRVRDALDGEDVLTIEDVAAQLHVTSRTLRRHLAHEQTSFRQVLDEVRAQRAEDLLADGVTVEQAARRVGYSNTPAFTAAFRRWKGMSPREYLRDTAIKRPNPD